MCLYTKQLQPKVAEKDIICYKALSSPWQGSRIAYAPYQIYGYEIGKLHFTKLGRVKDSKVERGFHTCKDAAWATYYHTDSTYIYECIIPQGSRYYEGYSVCVGVQIEGYVSDKLIVKKIDLRF